MRVTAPVIGGTAIALALALVWYFRPETSLVSEATDAPAPAVDGNDGAGDTVSVQPNRNAASVDEARAAVVTPNDESSAGAVPDGARSPLPGETPSTPMAQMLADRQQNIIVQNNPADRGGLPPGLAEGEREFAAEPIDGTWGPGAEANLLATFAQVPGLELIDLQVECRSTMCRVQLTQPTRGAAQGSPMPFNVLRDEIGLTPRWMMVVVDQPGAPTAKSIAYLWRDGFAPKREPGARHDAN